MRPYIPAFLCAILILVLSIMPNVQLPEVLISPDKLGHLAAYGLLAWLVFFGLEKDGRFYQKTAICAVIGVSVYGILLEVVQWAFFPHRFFEVWDMVANITGACFSWLVFNFKSEKRR